MGRKKNNRYVQDALNTIAWGERDNARRARERRAARYGAQTQDSDRAERARQQGRYPGSTRYVGSEHKSQDNPYTHTDVDITDLDGRTNREHSTDPQDIALGKEVAETIHDTRKRHRKNS